MKEGEIVYHLLCSSVSFSTASRRKIAFHNITYIHNLSVAKNILRKLGVKRSIPYDKELMRPIDVKDMLNDDKFPPSLVNTTTDNLKRVFTEGAWEKVELMRKLI